MTYHIRIIAINQRLFVLLNSVSQVKTQTEHSKFTKLCDIVSFCQGYTTDWLNDYQTTAGENITVVSTYDFIICVGEKETHNEIY